MNNKENKENNQTIKYGSTIILRVEYENEYEHENNNNEINKNSENNDNYTKLFKYKDHEIIILNNSKSLTSDSGFIIIPPSDNVDLTGKPLLYGDNFRLQYKNGKTWNIHNKKGYITLQKISTKGEAVLTFVRQGSFSLPIYSGDKSVKLNMLEMSKKEKGFMKTLTENYNEKKDFTYICTTGKGISLSFVIEKQSNRQRSIIKKKVLQSKRNLCSDKDNNTTNKISEYIEPDTVRNQSINEINFIESNKIQNECTDNLSVESITEPINLYTNDLNDKEIRYDDPQNECVNNMPNKNNMEAVDLSISDLHVNGIDQNQLLDPNKTLIADNTDLDYEIKNIILICIEDAINEIEKQYMKQMNTTIDDNALCTYNNEGNNLNNINNDDLNEANSKPDEETGNNKKWQEPNCLEVLSEQEVYCIEKISESNVSNGAHAEYLQSEANILQNLEEKNLQINENANSLLIEEIEVNEHYNIESDNQIKFNTKVKDDDEQMGTEEKTTLINDENLQSEAKILQNIVKKDMQINENVDSLLIAEIEINKHYNTEFDNQIKLSTQIEDNEQIYTKKETALENPDYNIDVNKSKEGRNNEENEREGNHNLDDIEKMNVIEEDNVHSNKIENNYKSNVEELQESANTTDTNKCNISSENPIEKDEKLRLEEIDGIDMKTNKDHLNFKDA